MRQVHGLGVGSLYLYVIAVHTLYGEGSGYSMAAALVSRGQCRAMPGGLSLPAFPAFKPDACSPYGGHF